MICKKKLKIYIYIKIYNITNMEKIDLTNIDIVIYHKNCQDGLTSAYIFKFFCEKNNKNIDLIDCYHTGEELDLNKLKNKNIIMVDIMTDNYEDIKNICNNMIILDHHKTSLNKYKNENYILLDMDKCGAVLSYEYCDKEEVPKFIKCIQARDLWLWNVEYAEEFTTGYFEKSNDKNVDNYKLFKNLMNDKKLLLFNEIVEYGKELINIKNKKIKVLFEKIKIENVKILNTEKTYNIIKFNANSEEYKIRSDFGNYCMGNTDIDFIVIYIKSKISNEYYCSLRSSKNKVNLVEENIAKGHPCAAGLTLNIHPDKFFINV